MESNKPKSIVFYSAGEASAVRGCRASLFGVEGHPALGNQSWVLTSKVVDVRDNGRTIETENTIYKRMEG